LAALFIDPRTVPVAGDSAAGWLGYGHQLAQYTQVTQPRA